MFQCGPGRRFRGALLFVVQPRHPKSRLCLLLDDHHQSKRYSHFRRLPDSLEAIPGVTFCGITDRVQFDHQVPTFAFRLDGYNPGQVAEWLGQEGIFVSDGNYYALPVKQGARVIRQCVVEDGSKDGLPQIKGQHGPPEAYDLLAVAVGVNTAALSLFEGSGFGFKPPRTTKCVVREYYLGAEAVEKHKCGSTHAFLLNIPRLEFAAVVPKGDCVTLILMGEDINQDLLQRFVGDPVVKALLPPGCPLDQVAGWCAPWVRLGCSLWTTKALYAASTRMRRWLTI